MFRAILGWGTAFWVCGVVFGTVAMAVVFFVVRSKPEDMGLVPDGVKAE